MPFDVISTTPEVAHANYHLGLLMEADGRESEAMDHFAEAIGIDPEFAEAHVELGVLEAEADKLAECPDPLPQGGADCSEDGRGSPPCRRGLPARPGGRTLAISHFKKALTKSDLANAPRPGRRLCEDGDFAGSTREFREATALRPDDPVVHRELGLAPMNEGKVEEAVAFPRGALPQARLAAGR